MIYLDTSALAAYYLPEKKSTQVQNYLQGRIITISELTIIEFYSALSIRVRTNTILLSDARKIKSLFNTHLRNDYYKTKILSSKHFIKAGEYIAAFDTALKAPDALHLAIAEIEGLMLVTMDKQLANNALKQGISLKTF